MNLGRDLGAAADRVAVELHRRRRLSTDHDLVSGHPVERLVGTSGPAHALVEGLGLADTNYYIGYTAWLDLAPLGVSKASGLSLVCERLGVAAEEVLAIGDGFNDVEMLEWAGRGVAMGQAPDRLKDVADAVTGTWADDGVVIELSRYF